MKLSFKSGNLSLKSWILLLVCIFYCILGLGQSKGFVQVKGHQFTIDAQPYYYIGANYWYGGLLGLERDKVKGAARLYKELDFLASKGVSNLRVMIGAEGSGQINGVQRVGPALQPQKGIFKVANLQGLDLLLREMGKRNMKAILFFSNNWEWSGGFLQYLNWNGLLPDSILRRRLVWDEMRDYVSKFYTCTPCKEDYKKQVSLVLSRTNTLTGKKYTDDPAIMAWELANEPRPMRPASNIAYVKWIEDVAAFIKSKDKKHLVTLGHEGEIGTESMPLYEQVHTGKNIDYLTIHIWPKNWSWFADTSLQRDMPQVLEKTNAYIRKHISAAQKLNKPLVIEEFGLPRDEQSFDIASATSLRDQYYNAIFSIWKQHAQSGGVVAGANFWAFGGTARPIKDQIFWKGGDDYMGDPPMEEQGLNTVFDSDKTTWDLVYSYTSSLKNTVGRKLPADK